MLQKSGCPASRNFVDGKNNDLHTMPPRAQVWLWKGFLCSAILLVGLFIPHTAFADTVATNSTNWGGYVADGDGGYQSATMNWVVPCISIGVGSPVGDSSVWVGLGGVNGNLVQAGTDSNVLFDGAGNPTTEYFAWVENLGADNSAAIMEFQVSCGDQMSSTISNGNQMQIQDLTSGASKTESYGPPADTSTGECIVERGTASISFTPIQGLVPLAAFQPTTITNCVVNPTSALADAAQPIGQDLYGQETLVGDNGHTQLENIGPLDANGGFTVTWQASY